MINYIISIEGKDVWNTFKCFITSLKELDEVRKILKRDYGIEFEDKSSNFVNNWYWKFRNITNNKDIILVIYEVKHYSLLP